jgi:tetratricopeptide (TPR) repeat protein
MKKICCLFALGTLLLAPLPVAHAQGIREAARLTKEGAEALKAKDYDRAVDLFRRAAELDPRNTKSYSAALQQKAYALTAAQKYQQAIEDYGAALEITPDDPGIFERRAYAEMRLGDYDHALADYNELLKRKPNETRYLLYRSYIYEVKGDIPNGMADVDKVLQSQHNNQEAKARKDRLTKLQQSQPQPMPSGPITAPQQPAQPPPKKP